MRKANNGRLCGPIESTAYYFSQALDIKTFKGDKIGGITELRMPEINLSDWGWTQAGLGYFGVKRQESRGISLS